MSKNLINICTYDLRWIDMDAYAHVGNSRYYDFMTDARVAALGENLVLSDLQHQYVVAESGCKFKKPIQYPGKIVIKQYCGKIGKSSFHLEYEFSMQDNPDALCAEGYVVMVCYDSNKKSPTKLPDEVITLLSNE